MDSLVEPASQTPKDNEVELLRRAFKSIKFIKENSTSATACSTFSSALRHFIISVAFIFLSSTISTPYGPIKALIPRSVPFVARTYRILVHSFDFRSNRVHITCNDIGSEARSSS
jgi:hypothetical protein